MSESLPVNWTTAPLADLAWVGARRFDEDAPDDRLVSFVPMAAVGEQSGRAKVRETRRWGDVKRGYTPMRDGDIVFAKITPCMENGKVALLEGLRSGVGAGSTELVVIRPGKSLDARFVLRFLLRESLRRDARAVMQGAAGQLRVPLSFLENLMVPLPPLAEQRRIVAALEEHLSELDAAVAGLERARANALRISLALRDSALAAHPRVRLGELLSQSLANGRSVPTAESGFPVLRLTCLKAGTIDQNEFKIGAWSAMEARPHLIREGDFLISRGNGSRALVGRGGLVGEVQRDVAYPDTLIRARPDSSKLLADYLRIAWDSLTVRRQIEGAARTTAGIYKINQQDIARIEIPLPSSVQEQRRVVAELDERLGACDRCVAEIDIQLARATRLRQSILKHAFEGKLVAQDPNDEPASVLLDRILAEREAPVSRAPRSRAKTKVPVRPRRR